MISYNMVPILTEKIEMCVLLKAGTNKKTE